jgi:hypothetical protein
LSEHEAEDGIRKLTKTERPLHILLLFCAIYYCGLLIFSYIQPDSEYLEFARTAGWHITAFLGLIIGVLLVGVISGRKGVKKQKNAGLFFLLTVIPCITAIIIVFMLVFSFVKLSMSDPNPSDYLLSLLSISGVMFVYGVLLSFTGLYIDDIAKKLKKQELNNEIDNEIEIENNIQKQTKFERNNNIGRLFCAVVLCGLFLIFYPLPDSEYLEFARDMGWYFTGFLSLAIGGLLAAIISGRKRVKKSKNTGLSILLGFVLCIAVFVIMLTFPDSFFIHRGFFEPTDPNDYLRILLSLSGLMFAAGIFIGFTTLYMDDFAEKYFKGMKF